MARLKFQVMVLGCSSHAGKSLVAAALCRILNDRGLRVAPFKAQNMSLNSGPTLDGGEIGRAQLLQAEAARCLPYREMNPVLLKPTGKGSQVMLMGKPAGLMSTAQYFRFWPKAAARAQKAYHALSEIFEALVIEGAGSPAEVNLAQRDLSNLETAKFSKAPWILVADIERGGAFASVAGTLELVPAWMRKRCLGVVFNKFRGDAGLLNSGIRFLKR
jgi:adenosylcobyric acid synthase